MDARTALDRIGHGAALTFALFTGLGPAGMYLGLLGMTLCAIVDRQFWRWMGRHALFWIAIVGGSYYILRGFLPTAYPVNEGQFADTREGMIVLTGIYGFVVGWWLLRRAQTRRAVLLLFPLGMVLGLIFMTEPQQWQELLSGRPFYGQMRGNAAGLYSATIVIGCLTLGIPFLRQSTWSPLMRKAGWSAMGLLIVLCLALVILSAARSVVLAAGVCLTVYVINLASRKTSNTAVGSDHPDLRRGALIAAIAVPLVVVAGTFIASYLDGLDGNLGALLEGNLDQLERNSLGYRIAIADTAVRNILEHPILGLGFGTAQAAIEASELSVLHRDHFHFHNLYLQVAAMTGLLGLAFLLTTIAIAFRYAWHGASHPDPAIRRLARFTLYSGLFFLVASLFQVRYDDPPGLALISLLIGCALVCRNARGDSPGRAAT